MTRYAPLSDAKLRDTLAYLLVSYSVAPRKTTLAKAEKIRGVLTHREVAMARLSPSR